MVAMATAVMAVFLPDRQQSAKRCSGRNGGEDGNGNGNSNSDGDGKDNGNGKDNDDDKEVEYTTIN